MSALWFGSRRCSRSTIGAALVAAGLGVLALQSPAADAAGICQDRLANNVYSCNYKAETGDRFQECFSFSTPGALSDDFDVFLDGLNDLLACDCKTRGLFDEPDFGSSLMFHCVSNMSESFNIALQGRAGQNRITKGQEINSFGTSFVFECTIDPDCDISPQVGVAGADSGMPRSRHSGLAPPSVLSRSFSAKVW